MTFVHERLLDYVSILVILLVDSAVYVISRVSEPNLEAVNFVRAIEGRRLSGSVIKKMEGSEIRDIFSV